MRKASLFVLPSLKEGFPKTLLEAMSCGKPVVTFDIPGIRETVKDKNVGMLVPSKEPNALAKAIITLLNDESLRHYLGKKARKLVLEKYNWDLIIDKTEKVYNEAISERK
jgi:glycosyltransferase involved in cell wall biosynthesis